MQESKQNKWWWVVGLVAVLAIVVGLVKSNKTESPIQETSEPADENPANPETAVFMYKDGSYAATGPYSSPAGPESIDVALTIQNGLIVDALVTPKATNEVSLKLQNAFNDGYKTLVIGKKLDEVMLDKVSGSSLTPKGWNEAVDRIKEQARI